MNKWRGLFVATVCAAPAFTGVIFVGVAISLYLILSLVKLPEGALPALILLLTILIPRVLFFVFSQEAGLKILITSIILWLFISKMNHFIFVNRDEPFKRPHIFNLIINQLAIVPYIISGFIACCNRAMMDVWVLFVEINR